MIHRPSDRATAYAAINSLGAVVSLSDLEGGRLVVEHPFDPLTRKVLRGPNRGEDVDILELLTRRMLRHSYGHIRAETMMVRPWWRWWRPTPVLRLIAEGRP